MYEKKTKERVITRAQQLLFDKKYDEYKIEIQKTQYKEGYYIPLYDKFEEYYTKEIKFIKK